MSISQMRVAAIFQMRDAAELEKRIDAILATVKAEVLRASAKHPPMHSSHECYGIMAEELHEFFLAMIANDLDDPKKGMKVEASQIAAMGVRAILDCPNWKIK